MLRIEEIVIVEGRDDTAAVKRAVDCETIETHGYGISADTWKAIERAYREKGIIIFTDPDNAGRKIRDRIKERFPEAKEAFLTLSEALKNDDIGIENAGAADIAYALSKVCTTAEQAGPVFVMADLAAKGLTGPGSRKKREEAGRILGIGYGNAHRFLDKLNRYGITKEEFDDKIPQ